MSLKDRLLPLYHKLPSPVRSVMATVHGRKLRSWRYGPDTDRLVREAAEREFWTASQWEAWTRERLRHVLERAATRVPYYRNYWQQQGTSASWERLEDWPILEKEIIRQDPRALVADDCDLSRMFHNHTSGTTGKSLDLWFSRETLVQHYALMDARWRGWYGVSRHTRWGMLGGQLVVPVATRKPPFWVWNGAMNQLYLSSYHLAPDLLPAYVDAIREYKLEYLWGYTSSLYTLAQAMIEQKVKGLGLKVAIANAEPVFPYQRQAILEAFECPLEETYGMTETVAAASQCLHGRLHLWPEEGIVEIFSGSTPVPRGSAGELIVTGLLNADMPLIRYRVGDCGVLPVHETPCPCGRTLPELQSVEGRTDDVLFTPDGRRIGRLDPIFKAQLPIREAQIVQEALDRVRIRYVPVHGFNESSAQSMIERLKSRMGEIEVVLEALEEVPRGANGKFRSVICQISATEKARLLNR